jgi:hypothetical protein
MRITAMADGPRPEETAKIVLLDVDCVAEQKAVALDLSSAPKCLLSNNGNRSGMMKIINHSP